MNVMNTASLHKSIIKKRKFHATQYRSDIVVEFPRCRKVLESASKGQYKFKIHGNASMDTTRFHRWVSAIVLPRGEGMT